jgi:ribose 5-phosphate isomerase B
MTIAFACDHVGVELKRALMEHASGKGYICTDLGCDGAERAEYPIYGYKAANAVSKGVYDLGVLICGTGVGMSLTANKVKGIRAVVCSEPYSAMLSKQHNNTNVLAMGARVVGVELAKMTMDAWLDAEHQGGRHSERVDMIMEIERTGAPTIY